MYWQIIYRNETGYLVLTEFIIANDYKKIAVYVEKRIKDCNGKIIYYIDKIPKRRKKKHEIWVDLRE